MTLKGDVKFKGKLTYGLKTTYIRNLVNFHASSRKSENFHFYWILLSKTYIDLDEKIQIYVSWHWRVMQRNLVNFHPTTQKSENFTSMGHFCPKYLRFELKKYRGVIFHGTEYWCKILINPELVVSKMA